MITAAVDAQEYVLAVLAMLTAVDRLAFLYLRIIVAMYMGDAGRRGAPHPRARQRRLASASRSPSPWWSAFLPGLVVDFARTPCPATALRRRARLRLAARSLRSLRLR